MLSRPQGCGLCYIPEAYGQQTHGIMGRQSAGREFLKAYVAARKDETQFCVAATPDDFAMFGKQIERSGGDPGKAYHVGSNDVHSIARIGTLYWPDPVIAPLAWTRRSLSDSAYSLCGVTHTLSESGVIRAIQELFVTPVHEWDALICTSHAARKAVEAIAADWSAYLEERVGAPGRLPLQLPVIPLGVDAERFRRTDATAAAGIALRRRLGIPDEAVVALYFGRLNFLTKSHPTPMFMALDEAASMAAGVDMRLLMVGQFSNPLVEAEFRDLAAKYCQKVPIHWVDGNDDIAAEASWYASDFFISLSDNMQETFGMTVAEAMAASLPCIVSDWSGLRESVVDGETGFMVPSRLPSRNVGAMFMTRAAYGIESFDDSVAALHQVIDVDVSLCAARIATIAANPDLRRKMASQGRTRIEQCYDWAQIIAQYEDLWRELAAIRASHGEAPVPRSSARPGQVDPFAAFGHFATGAIGPESRVSCLGGDARHRVLAIHANPSHTMLLPMLPPMQDMLGLVEFATERRNASVAEIQAAFRGVRVEKVELALLWLAKFGILKIVG